MEWVASTLTLPRNTVYPTLLPLMRTSRLPVIDRTDTAVDLNGLLRFAERPSLVSARVSSHLKRSLVPGSLGVYPPSFSLSTSTCLGIVYVSKYSGEKFF
jgi:hypothetical protein